MKNILITGGAGGIGSQIAIKFLQEGFNVYSLDLQIKDLGENFYNIVCDVTSIKELKKVKNTLKEIKFSHIISLAGRALSDEWMNFNVIDINSITKSINLNLTSHLYVVHTFLDLLDKEYDKKSVILTSSINAYGGFGLPIYSAAKGGLVSFTKASHAQLSELGIRINTICPGTIVTEATLKEPKDFESLLKTTKLGRFMTKEEVADLAYELCEQSTKTGCIINIDAGQNEVVNGTSN